MEKNNKNLVIVTLYAEAYYSGNTEEETLVLTENTFNEVKDILYNKTYNFYELDGKHSCVEGELSHELIEERLLNTKYWDNIYINNSDKLIEAIGLEDEELEKEFQKVKDIINSVDYMISININCKKSEKEKYGITE